ncbi:MAG: DUF1638 domain-containing protein [Candidatus Methanoperedens sp.]|nr:DUF1638 domain-containing protein [Candidatus Methanoperedens sp.]
MPVLSIIACGMLEGELAYVLSGDSELAQLILVENGEHFGLQRKLRSVTVVATILRRGLHADIERVRKEVYRKILEMSPFSDRILIFYGTCGHSLTNLEKDFESLDCQLYFLKDEKGEIVEDCISAALGGNDVYARTLFNGEGAGTFYLTPMWASNWEEKPEDNAIFSSKLDKKFLKLLGKAAKINTGLSYEPESLKSFLEKMSGFDYSPWYAHHSIRFANHVAAPVSHAVISIHSN